MHSDNDTNPKHNKSRHFRTRLDQSRNCPISLSWSLDLETLESDASSGKSAGAIAKDRGWPSSSVRQRVAAHKRGDSSPRYVGGVERRLTPELLDEMREFIQEEQWRNSMRTVAVRFTLSRACSRKTLRLLRLQKGQRMT